MKNTLTSIFALVLGFITVTFAAVIGLFVGLGALIARPFIKKKINAAYEEALKQQGYGQMHQQAQSGSTIDGEYEDITQSAPHGSKQSLA
ncbi:hypothetical protein [Photobacterium lutimaris]|uniref:Uncharacterized protein n=1 Tax=Photobacterium lutimaris TaxID=388278 RepID=A0A2T3J4I2_9GAMM|nr:hypothetical protein [Photobacterium lutimaris]PSU36189.1 hypothetical protein C9I99_04095 [Photobacterium lutimaris]TDR74940.1 hypothetical protein DFP78_106271 [Photobacterium lutimaris]